MKREREKHITRLHLILVGLVLTIGIITLIVVNVRKNNKIARYKELEKNLKIATKYYFKNNKLEVNKGERKIIKMKTIIENGYLQDELTNPCDGYTVISNYKINGEYKLEYEAYIKCGNSYKTYGYE